MVWLHILMGAVGLISGWVAISVEKGRRWHGIAGQVFVGSMLTMAASGTLLAALECNAKSTLGGGFTFYLVGTAWITVNHRMKWSRQILASLAAFAILLVGYALLRTIQSLNAGGAGSIAFELFIAILAMLSALSDARQLRVGAVSGRARVARHAWRMVLALALASAAFFLGQADEFPRALQHFGLLSMPVMLAMLAIPYWLARIRWGRWTASRRKAGPGGPT